MEIGPVTLQNLLPAQTSREPKNRMKQDFKNVLFNALEEVNKAQVTSNRMTEKFLTGEVQDIHQVTIAMEEAKLMLQLAVEVRNKVVEAYQEISRMQV